MYQFFLISIILFCLGGAGYVTISHGSVAKIYTSSSNQDKEYETILSDKILTIDDLEKQQDQESNFVTIFKTLIGIKNESGVTPTLAKTVAGTYSCMNFTNDSNCSSVYTFIFKTNSAAVLRISDEDGNATGVEVGTWGFNDQGQIVVNLYADSKKRFEENRIFTLTRAQRGSALITVDYPRGYYPDILTGIFKFIKK